MYRQTKSAIIVTIEDVHNEINFEEKLSIDYQEQYIKFTEYAGFVSMENSGHKIIVHKTY